MSSNIVTVFVVSPDTRSERRFDRHLTVEQLKNKLEHITGIPIANQAISVLNADEDVTPLATLSDSSRPLGFYGITDFQILKVSDMNPSSSFTGQLTDVSQVEKFELSDVEYAQRQDSVLAYKQRNKVGRFAPKDEQAAAPSPSTPLGTIPIGARCEVESSEEDFRKRGTVRFFGQTKFGKGDGIWVGVEYDEPIGKNDGSVQGERYFSCRPNYGVFVRPDRVNVGDFPVEDIDMEEM